MSDKREYIPGPERILQSAIDSSVDKKFPLILGSNENRAAHKNHFDRLNDVEKAIKDLKITQQTSNVSKPVLEQRVERLEQIVKGLVKRVRKERAKLKTEEVKVGGSE